jgi:hypothetical protein
VKSSLEFQVLLTQLKKVDLAWPISQGVLAISDFGFKFLIIGPT